MPKPIISLTAGASPTEGGTIGTYLITLDTPAPVGGLTVNFDTVGSTATANDNYSFAAGNNLTAVTSNSFTIAEGATSATLNLVVNTDTVVDSDPNETVEVNLAAGAGYQLGSGTFFPKVDYAAIGAVSVGIGDFNNDGKLDLALVNGNASNGVSVLSGNATGFDAAINYAAGSWPYSIGVGDFNGDGKLDLAITTLDNSNLVSVLYRNAANTGFDPKIDYTTGTSGGGASSISVGDFNNDGKTDLVVTTGISVSVLYRNAANTGFDSPVDYATQSSYFPLFSFS